MTREEAVNILENDLTGFVEGTPIFMDAFWMAVDALKQLSSYEQTINKLTEAISEQEPCEDAISRQAVLELIADYDLSMGQVVKGIHALPSVKPQEPKTGHWIEVIDEIDSLGNKTCHHKCSICGNEDSGWGNYKYCPRCGARMVEPQENRGESS